MDIARPEAVAFLLGHIWFSPSRGPDHHRNVAEFQILLCSKARILSLPHASINLWSNCLMRECVQTKATQISQKVRTKSALEDENDNI